MFIREILFADDLNGEFSTYVKLLHAKSILSIPLQFSKQFVLICCKLSERVIDDNDTQLAKAEVPNDCTVSSSNNLLSVRQL